jgi:hypothetical protein
VSTEVQMSQDFQARIFSKIRESIGDLMTDDDLRKLVEAAMQKAFFTEVPVPGDYYGRSPKVEPPHLVQLVKTLLDERVKAAAQKWLEDHPEEVTKAINDAIGKGIFGILQNYIESKTSTPLWQLAESLRQKGVLT